MADEQPGHLPIAEVTVDTPLAHLDRTFDYLVPERLDADCVPGCRVRVRFAGQDLDGFVLGRKASSSHTGRLLPLRRVLSAEPVLTPDVARLARLVADRYAGTLSDVIRLAIPPRRAKVESEPTPEPAESTDSTDAEESAGTDARPWDGYPTGEAFLAALARGDSPRAVWTALPGEDWPACLAAAADATLAGGRGALLIVPDRRDVERLDAACGARLGIGRHVTLTADLGPTERYRRFLAASRGRVRCVIGTRAAAFAPVADLGLVACWDDGDDLHVEPRAPYPHVREVLLLRAHDQDAAALIGGHARTAEAAQLIDSGWARALEPDRRTVRDRAPRVFAVGESAAELARDPAARAVRLPHKAFEVARAALAEGPVLIQVPRAGYLPALACRTCRTPARCTACNGPLQVGRASEPAGCAWCGQQAVAWTCRSCGGRAFRAPVVGATRTAEELGRAFPRVPVITSGGSKVLTEVGGRPALVVCTPGAEPVVTDSGDPKGTGPESGTGGYAAALLLDSWLSLARPELRAGEETLRRWFNAAGLVRSARLGGSVVVVADPAVPEVQALVRWSPEGYAERERTDRQAVGFPPAVRVAVVDGDSAAVTDLSIVLQVSGLPDSAELLGPVPIDRSPAGADGEPASRLMIRVPRSDGAGLSAALKAAQGIRTARKDPGTIRVKIDPYTL